MADDLGDEWWLEKPKSLESEESHRKDVTDKAPTSLNLPKKKNDPIKPINKTQKAGDKRKASESTSLAEGSFGVKEKKKSKKSKKEKQAPKRQKRRITDVSEDELSRPGSLEDVRALMSKELKSRLSEEALEELVSDLDDVFFPNNEENLGPSEYLTNILPNWSRIVKKSMFMKKNGCPSLILVTSSAVRAVELNRQIKEFLGEKCKVAKLFAKHMKVKEQKQFLMKQNIQCAVGTPARILVLVEEGALHLESLSGFVLDWNWRDYKLKRLPDIQEVRRDLVSLLKDFILETIKGSPCKMALL